MNILYVPNKDPRCANGGNEQRTHNLWESLKKHGRVYTIVVDNNLAKDYVLVEGEHPILLFRQEIKSKFNIWFFVVVVFSILNKFCIYEYKLYRNYLPIEKFGDIKFDIVVSRYVSASCRWKLWEIAPSYIDIDDHPLQVFENTVKLQLIPLFRPLAKWLLKRQLAYIVKNATAGWIANENQVKICDKLFVYLPNIPLKPPIVYNPKNCERKYLFTIGNMAYLPNYEGVNKFIDEIWPKFHIQFPQIKYYIGGKGAPANLIAKWNAVPGVEYVGFISDLSEVYQHCIATVVPIYKGGGTCIKSLESLAYSRICISTPFGARGIDFKNSGNSVMVFNDVDEFINCYSICVDQSISKDIEEYAYSFIAANYSIEVFDFAVDKVICQK